MDTRIDRLFGATAAIENVYWIGGLLAQDGEDSRLFRSFMEDLYEEDCVGLFPGAPDNVIEYMREEDFVGVAEWLLQSGTTGFVLRVSTPVMEVVNDAHRNYSWALTHYGLIYGETFDAALDAAMLWVEGQRAKELAKAKAIKKLKRSVAAFAGKAKKPAAAKKAKKSPRG